MVAAAGIFWLLAASLALAALFLEAGRTSDDDEEHDEEDDERDEEQAEPTPARFAPLACFDLVIDDDEIDEDDEDGEVCKHE